ncbi:uncharacterized protein MELLADRAFT_90046 [Melampsora larici-populina 98AG31]|uniref:Uncharacterized protein n=1 Tax=Melampsora larici-populina (strain 98AG31 / pathotype 3-4-7) TaxID=747676 RepID=F4RVI9_MELLP|nr:uncharacterized protein MELLADRAFT_90046 [Melampsora larici-populina 98AG31]EGG03628.1 hypothetical protein MELLADRAFT_90046 [Melampsora larici-populina 98AG31]
MMDTRHIPQNPVPHCAVIFHLCTSLSMHLLQRRPGVEWHFIKEHRSESEIGCEELTSLAQSRIIPQSACTIEIDSSVWSHRPTHSLANSIAPTPPCESPSPSSEMMSRNNSSDPSTNPSTAATTPDTLKSGLSPNAVEGIPTCPST